MLLFASINFRFTFQKQKNASDYLSLRHKVERLIPKRLAALD